MNSKRQIEMDFTPGLTQQHRDLLSVLRTVIYSARGGLDSISAAMDRNPSAVSKMLNIQDEPDNQRRFPVEHLETVIRETGDLRPIYYLIEKFCVDPETKRKQALDRVPVLLKELEEVLREARR